MLAIKQIADHFGIDPNTAKARVRRAGIKPCKKTKNLLYFPKEQALKHCCNIGETLPPGTTTISELAAQAERTKGCITYRLKKAAVEPCGSIIRQIPGKRNSGGRAMLLYPQREALAAALDKD